jgi:hypothetical protein
MQLNQCSKQAPIADLQPLAAAVRGDAGRGGQTTDSVGEGERQVQYVSGGGRT